MRLVRTGRAVRLIQTDGRAATADAPDPVLIKLLLKGRGWWQRLSDGEIDIPTLARAENFTPSYITRIVRLEFLAPPVVEAIVTGTQPALLDGKKLTAPEAIPISWAEQQLRLLNGIGA